MKKAVIQTGGKQYLVSEKQVLDVELTGDKKTLSFHPLLIIDGDKVSVGQPLLDKQSVTASVIEDVKADKVIAIRYKAKKRVDTRRGHRQKLHRIRIDKIS